MESRRASSFYHHPPTPTFYHNNVRYRPDILDIALMRDDIDNAIGALTSHITTVVENSSRKVPAKSDRKELPRDVIELIRIRMLLCVERANTQPVKIGPCACSAT
ncbi:hypothetical protein EVAR_65193_1 [Eumeta japonica]|uniref:Uncharacterized protein n=1 Tax=Eumeta variegata TaxID=151549 RepID=A0A4C1ZJH2_EUMVA|nr:hypothetical protein EVAR_65193_1 [Eumeta japonica]